MRALCRFVVGTVALCAPSLSFGQTVRDVYVTKERAFDQTSSTAASPSVPSYRFFARVDGGDLASITPPVVSGPIGAGSGQLVYGHPFAEWLFGGEPYSTQAALDAAYGSGLYTITVNGTAVPLNLSGDEYPNAPVMTLSGGEWSGNTYVVDPSRGFTIVSNPFAGYGSHADDEMHIYVGDGARNVVDFFQSHSSTPGSNVGMVTVPPNALVSGVRYYAATNFTAWVDVNRSALPSSVNRAGYRVVTNIQIVVGQPSIPQVFPMTVTSNITPTTATVQAAIQPRAQDVGTTQSIFVFFVAPSNLVHGASLAKAAATHVTPKNAPKDTPIQCVLAQLNSQGQLAGVTSANLAPYVTTLLGAQNQAVNVLTNVPTGNVAGATPYVGYGRDSQSMYDHGVNQSTGTIPGSVTCQPERPEKGWWWNPKEDGRGYSIETVANRFFFASFLYDVSGRATWYVATGDGATLDGSLISQRDLLAARGGQTLGGSYPGVPALAKAGEITMAFNDSRHGTLVWPGGIVPIERFPIVPNGITMAAGANQPESGWWWNPDEAGRGFFLEWQGGVLDIAGYMYDENGDPIWYLSENLTPSTNLQQFSSSWWQFADGMTLAGPWKPNRQVSGNVAPVTIQFSGPDTALMTLPNGRTTQLVRQRF